MTSDRLREAVAELNAHRARSRATPELDLDLFMVIDNVLDNVIDHAGAEWTEQALQRVHTCACEHRKLTVEDVAFPETLDNRARGAVMLIAARKGWVQRIGWVNGDQGRHGRPIALWASRIYQGPGYAA